MSESFKPQQGERELVANPYRYELNAAPGALELPSLCARCAALATDRLTFAKVFRLGTRQGHIRYEVLHATIPCCPACQAQHLAEAPPRSAWSKLATMILSEAFLVALFPGAVGAFLLWLAVHGFGSGARDRGSMLASVGALFALLAVVMASRARSTTVRRRVPPLTSVTRAFDFSNNVAALFEPPRYVYALANEKFARAFIAANGERAWDPKGPTAERAARKRSIYAILVWTLIAAWVLWEIADAVFHLSGPTAMRSG
jgi:hypothetical protein